MHKIWITSDIQFDKWRGKRGRKGGSFYSGLTQLDRTWRVRSHSPEAESTTVKSHIKQGKRKSLLNTPHTLGSSISSLNNLKLRILLELWGSQN